MNANTEQIQSFLAQAHQCAGQMLANSMYVQKELPNLRMSEGLRARLNELCTELISTKHDVISELMELREEFEDGTCSDQSLQPRMQMICGWITSCTMQFHSCIEEARQEIEQGHADSLLAMLLMESAVNILHTSPALPDEAPPTDAIPTQAAEAQPSPSEEKSDEPLLQDSSILRSVLDWIENSRPREFVALAQSGRLNQTLMDMAQAIERITDELVGQSHPMFVNKVFDRNQAEMEALIAFLTEEEEDLTAEELRQAAKVAEAIREHLNSMS